MKALYICDEKEEWNFLRNLFHAHFPKVELICAIKASDALDYLSYEGPIAIVIIECSMKEDNPSEIAQNIIETSGERPIIFLGTEAMLKDRVDEELFMQHDTLHTYKKPVDIMEFKNLIQTSLDWAQKEEFESSVIEVEKDNYLPLKLKNFYLFDQIPYDVFIELTKTKFIKAIAKNKPYTQSTIQDFTKRNIKVLYLEKNEHLNFLESSILKIEESLSKKNLKPLQVIQTQIAAALIIHQYLRDVGISEKIINLSETVIEATNKNFDVFNNLKEVLTKFPLEHADLAEQSILLSYFCEGMARGMGWRSDLSRKKLGLAALIHDCTVENEGMLRISNLESAEAKQFTPKEIEKYKMHPKEAAEFASHFSGFTDTDFIIEQHHELPDGSGFPLKLSANKLTAISCVFIISSNFVTQLALNGLTKSSLQAIVSAFSTHYNVGNFKEPLKIMKKSLKGL